MTESLVPGLGTDRERLAGGHHEFLGVPRAEDRPASECERPPQHGIVRERGPPTRITSPAAVVIHPTALIHRDFSRAQRATPVPASAPALLSSVHARGI